MWQRNTVFGLNCSLIARTKVLAELARSWGRFRFIYSKSCYNNCSFFFRFSPRGSKQILFWKCYWWREANTLFFLLIWLCNNIKSNLFKTNNIHSFADADITSEAFASSPLSLCSLFLWSHLVTTSPALLINCSLPRCIYLSIRVWGRLQLTSLPYLCMFLALKTVTDGWVHAEIRHVSGSSHPCVHFPYSFCLMFAFWQRCWRSSPPLFSHCLIIIHIMLYNTTCLVRPPCCNGKWCLGSFP